jgi:hypothetical protein
MARVRISSRLPAPGSRLRASHFRLALKSDAWSLRPFLLALIELAIVIALASVPLRAQTHYAKGQDVVPAFEGWEKNSDGSFNMVFGYMNRNYEEEIDLPVGADNMIEPGLADQGQPTHFYVRRQQFVFKVRVPKDWGKKDLIWTLRVNGKTEKAYASLLPFQELGLFVYQENRGSAADITDTPEPNEAPTIKMSGAAQLTARVGETIPLVAEVSDDGHPIPRRRAANGAPAVRRDSDGAVITGTGAVGPGGSGPRRENPLTQAIVRLDPGVALGVTWIVYRGSAGGVKFEPQRVAVKDGRASATVSFAKPGTYVVRGYADDGVLITPVDVTVTVR